MGSFKRLLLSTLLLFIVVSSSTLSSAKTFRCSSGGATCQALVDYVSPNATTLSAIRTLFSIRHLRSILGANNLPLSTPGNYPIASKQTIKIPFPCICNNGTGKSNGLPVYKVVPNDGLDHIAVDVFSRLVIYQEIQAANNISNPNIIDVGQSLLIPLPCSCDDVDGQEVVHYGHVVTAGSSVEGIAQLYNTSQATLLKLNNMSDPQGLQAGDIIDVPLRACSSMVRNDSLDYPLHVPNGTYTVTANNCIRCKCDATMNWMLQCEVSGLNSSCGAPIRCEGSDNLNLGNAISSGCNRTTCAYAGYRNRTILATVATDQSTCPAPGSSGTSLRVWRWNEVVIFANIMMSAYYFLL